MGRSNLFNISLLITALVLTLIGIAAQRRSQRYLVFVFVLPIYGYLILFTSYDNVVANCVLGSVITTFFFTSFQYLVVTDPQNEFHKANETPRSIREKPFFTRYLWASDLLSSPRGIGWAHESTTHLPPKPRTTTAAFLATQLLRLVAYTLLIEIAEMFHGRNPCFSDDGPPLGSFGPLWRMLSVAFIAASVVGAFNIQQIVLSIISVATGMSKAEEWRPLFGSWLDAYTLRRFWGKTWHQLLRTLVTGQSSFIAHKIFRLPRSGVLQAYIKVLFAFFISGLIHSGGDYMGLQRWDGGSLRFFILQVFAIAVEQITIALAVRGGVNSILPSYLCKAIGYTWVLFWFSCSFPIWLDSLKPVWFGHSRPSPSTFIRNTFNIYT